MTGQRNHTFLFRQGIWAADGQYHDSEGRAFSVRGETKITHLDDHWQLEGIMHLCGDEQAAFANRYEVVPFPEGRRDTTWVSFNPATGRLTGRFAIVEDTILSVFMSEDGRYSGSECLRQINNHTYRNNGGLFDGERLLSSWAVVLTMVSARKEEMNHGR